MFIFAKRKEGRAALCPKDHSPFSKCLGRVFLPSCSPGLGALRTPGLPHSGDTGSATFKEYRGCQAWGTPGLPHSGHTRAATLGTHRGCRAARGQGCSRESVGRSSPLSSTGLALAMPAGEAGHCARAAHHRAWQYSRVHLCHWEQAMDSRDTATLFTGVDQGVPTAVSGPGDPPFSSAAFICEGFYLPSSVCWGPQH